MIQFTLDMANVDRLIEESGIGEDFPRYSIYKTLVNLNNSVHSPTTNRLELEAMDYILVAHLMYSHNVRTFPKHMNTQIKRTKDILVYSILPEFINTLYEQLPLTQEGIIIDVLKYNLKWKVANVSLTTPEYAKRTTHDAYDKNSGT